MSFHQLTANVQEQIDEFSGQTINREILENVHELLEEYCTSVEEIYGINMVFEIVRNENDAHFRYEVTPSSELDGFLLKLVLEDESRVGRVSFTIN